jgi:hypothetical protein
MLINGILHMVYLTTQNNKTFHEFRYFNVVTNKRLIMY